jgi:hypothetical protein
VPLQQAVDLGLERLGAVFGRKTEIEQNLRAARNHIAGAGAGVQIGHLP